MLTSEGVLQEAREGAAYESSVYTEDSTLEQKHHDVGEAYAEQVPLLTIFLSYLFLSCHELYLIFEITDNNVASCITQHFYTPSF